jgi:hypothetical protein
VDDSDAVEETFEEDDPSSANAAPPDLLGQGPSTTGFYEEVL